MHKLSSCTSYFATAVTLKNGVPIETVRKMLGHKKISATQNYAEVDEEKFRSAIASIEKKLNNSETILVSTRGE